MEHREKGALKDFSELVGEFFNTERARELAALSIETSEQLAKSLLDFQARASEWANDTPLGGLFKAQNSIGRKFFELSFDTARRLCRVDESRAA